MKITYKNKDKIVPIIEVGDIITYYGDGDEKTCLVVDSGVVSYDTADGRYDISLLDLESMRIIDQFVGGVYSSELIAKSENIELIIL